VRRYYDQFLFDLLQLNIELLKSSGIEDKKAFDMALDMTLDMTTGNIK